MNKEELILELVGLIPQEPDDIYAACKRIDGHPEADGSFPIMGRGSKCSIHIMNLSFSTNQSVHTTNS
jgi:hypothetical protein